MKNRVELNEYEGSLCEVFYVNGKSYDLGHAFFKGIAAVTICNSREMRWDKARGYLVSSGGNISKKDAASVARKVTSYYRKKRLFFLLGKGK